MLHIAVWNWKEEAKTPTLGKSGNLVRELKDAAFCAIPKGALSKEDVVVNLAGTPALEDDKLAVVVVVKMTACVSGSMVFKARALRQRIYDNLGEACKKVYPSAPIEVMVDGLETGCRID